MKFVKKSDIPKETTAGIVNNVNNTAWNITARFLESFNSSTQQEMGISIIDTKDVSAAKNTSEKNIKATMLAPT